MASTPRVTPRVRWGILAYALYLAVFYGVWIANGIDYPHMGDNADTLWRWYAAPTAAGLVVIVTLVTIYGWWKPSIIERNRVSRWVWIIPIVLALTALLGLTANSSRFTPAMWLFLTMGSLFVGFNEELVTRGQLIVALRSRFGERGVWFVSTLLFALLHLPNVFFGLGATGYFQVFATFLLGSAFYLTRRVTGTLVGAMLLHGLWDFSITVSGGLLAFPISMIVGVSSVIVALVVTRKKKHEPVAAS